MSRKLRAIVLLVALAIGAVVMVAGTAAAHASTSYYNDPDATPTTLGSVNLPVAPRNEPINYRIPTWPWE